MIHWNLLKICKTYDTWIEKEGGKVKRWWEPGTVLNEKNTFFCYLWVGLPRWTMGFGHLDMPKFREPGFPRDSEAAQTARSWSGNRKGGIRGCDAQLRWAKNWWGRFSLPETNNKFAPEKMDGTGRRSGFLLGLGIFSGPGAFAVSFREGNPLEVEQFAPENIYIPSPKRRGKRLPVPSIFFRSFFAVQLPEGTRKKTRWWFHFFCF